MLPNEVISTLQAFLDTGKRHIVGLVGAPGVGKSTFSEQITAHFGNQILVIPMDGFHLANCELQRLERADRKGAPDTFDAFGYLELLSRLREQTSNETIYAPYFDRSLEESIAGGIAVYAHTRLIVTEGNYLLLESSPWNQVRDLLDETWFLTVNQELRLERLIARHMRYGRSENEAKAWVECTDEPNARLIQAGRSRATRVIDLTPAPILTSAPARVRWDSPLLWELKASFVGLA